MRGTAVGLGRYIPGLGVSVAVAALAWVLGRLAPVVGAPVIGIVCGVLVGRLVGRWSGLQMGISFAARTVLQLAVVALGAQLSLRQVFAIGAGSLPVMLGTLLACFGVAWWASPRMGVEADVRVLVGVGTAICGASAIAAVSPVIRARHSAVAYAISTIFLFNVAAVLVFPPLGHALGLSQHAFGLFAGTAVNDTSSVVAAAASYGSDASHDAVVVKLTRTLMIIPVCLGLAVLQRRRDRRDAVAAGETLPAGEQHVLGKAIRLVPGFLVGFLVLATANSLGVIPAASHAGVQTAALFLITVALAGIGLSTDVDALRAAGHRPLLLGFLLWASVTGVSLLLQASGL
jgi:uncharacterized integral membrane protein (TIGR00698 family)